MVAFKNGLPTNVGPYVILRQVGVGGMGTVYHARHIELKREVALKVLQPNSARNQTVLHRFRDEARAAAMPPHENIVIFYEHGEDSGYHYLALEFVKGRDLLALIEEKKQLPIRRSLFLMRQAAKALQHANDHGFVHRDIKPSNFLVSSNWGLKLTDMGLARHLEELEISKVTRDGTTVGTVDYMAPEQAKNSRDADIRSDIYSLGCTLYHMLTGSVPYPGGAALERLYKHVTEPTPDVRELNPKAPPEVADLCKRMMAKDPADRFQTPLELLRAIDEISQTLARSASSTTDTKVAKFVAPPPPVKTWTAPKKYVVMGASGSAALFVLLLIFALSRGGASRPNEKVIPAVLDPPPPPPVALDKIPPATKEQPREFAKDVTPSKPIDQGLTLASLDKTTLEKNAGASKAPASLPADPKAANAAATTRPDEKKAESKSEEKKPAKSKEQAEKDFMDAFKALGPPPGSGPQATEKDNTQFDLSEWRDRLKTSKGSTKKGRGGDAEAPIPLVSRLPEKNAIHAAAASRGAERDPFPFTEAERDLVFAGWTPFSPLPPSDRVFVVKRIADQEDDVSIAATAKQAWNTAMSSLAEKKKQPAIIEYQSDGPFFDGSHQFYERPAIFRGGQQIAPLVVYQETRVTDANYWFSLKENGRVVFDGIHFVINANEALRQNDEFDLFRFEGCDVTFRRCSITILGMHRRKINVIRMLSSAKTSPPPECRLHLQDCVIRAAHGDLLIVDAASSDVLIENSCLVTRTGAAIRFGVPFPASPQAQRRLRVVESSLLAGSDLLRVRMSQNRPAPLTVLASASVFASHVYNRNRPMVHVDVIDSDSVPKNSFKWKAMRVVYAGWPDLLAVQAAGRSANSVAADEAAWRHHWDDFSSEQIFAADRQSAFLPDDYLTGPYPIFGAGPWTFANGGQELLGYDAPRCLPLHPFWFEMAYGSFPKPVVDASAPLRDSTKKSGAISKAFILPQVTINDVIKENSGAARLELLFFTQGGRVKLQPVRLENQTLVIRFHGPNQAQNPVIVEIEGRGEAAFSVRGGSLAIENGRFEFPADKPTPDSFALLRGGELSIYNTQIDAPLTSRASNLSELIRVENLPSRGKDEWTRVFLTATSLASAASLLTIEAPGTALVVRNCVFVSGQDALRISFGERPPKDWHAVLDANKCTFCTMGSAFRLFAYPEKAALPFAPMVLSVQDCLFTDALEPKSGRDVLGRSSCVLAFDQSALARRAVTWQGDHNAFDQRLNRLAAPRGGESRKRLPDDAWLEWARLWGRRHEPFAYLMPLNFDTRMRGDRVQLDALVLSPTDSANLAGSDRRPVGADMSVFGVPSRLSGRAIPPRYADELTSPPLRVSEFNETGDRPSRERARAP